MHWMAAYRIRDCYSEQWGRGLVKACRQQSLDLVGCGGDIKGEATKQLDLGQWIRSLGSHGGREGWRSGKSESSCCDNIEWGGSQEGIPNWSVD